MWLAIFAVAAFAEIAGCFAFWSVFRLNATFCWLGPGVVALTLFAWLLTLADTDAAGRAFAGYGGIYIIASLVWLYLVEGQSLSRYDWIGAALCLVGAAVTLLAPSG